MLNAIPVFLGEAELFTAHHAAAAFAVLFFALMAGLPRLLVWLLPNSQ